MEPETKSESQPSDPRDLTLAATQIAKVVDRMREERMPNDPEAGLHIGEFHLLEEIGRGAFGRVYLAGQETLNRRVALKISRQRSMSIDEGKSLGGLEHDHIVKVYSAFTHAPTGWECLCLQYVPGTDLRLVIEHINKSGTRPSSGRDILAAIDAVGRRDATFDPAALRDRDALATDNFAQAVCRIGGRLAEALAFAHAKGVLHCDIKPGNILISPYGRPMLADFNVSFDRVRMGTDGGLGGTRAYMAPEYAIASMNRAPGGVDARCDVYSLGVVLFELATGSRPDQRPDALDNVPRELASVIRRSLHPDRSKRYQSAEELAAALTGAWQLFAAQRAMPAPERLGRWVLDRPLPALALAAVLPHIAASIVNIGFNAQRIEMNDSQNEAFLAVMIAYNLVAYPITFAIAVTIFRRVASRLPSIAHASGPDIDALRSRVCRLGRQSAIIGALGWFPGAVIFPLAIDIMAGPLEHHGAVYAHFLISIVLSGLIGVVFSYLGVQAVVFRALLPRLGNPDTFTPQRAAAEVRPMVAPFGPLVLLASTIPLTGALLLIAFAGDTRMTLGFRVLMAGLIGLGALGVTSAERSVKRLTRLASVWGSEGEGNGEANSPWHTHRSGVYKKPLF